MNNVLLCYNTQLFGEYTSMIEAFLTGHMFIEKWSSPFPGCYILKSSEKVDNLTPTFDPFFNNRQYIIAGVGPGTDEINGRAVAEIWEFLRDEDKENL